MHNPDLKPQITRFLADEGDTVALGAALACTLEPGLIVYLKGELGAGKTTFVRGVLRGLGYAERVKSPTFTLVEVYEFSNLYLYHFDFYRFDNPLELANTGFREYFRADAVCFVEWPDNAHGLPAADVRVALWVENAGRVVELCAETEAGELCLRRLQESGTT